MKKIDRKYIYERYFGLRGFSVPVGKLAYECQLSPSEIYEHIAIYRAFINCGVERPVFSSVEERDIFIYESNKGLNGRQKLSLKALAGMFDLKYNSVRWIVESYKQIYNNGMQK